MTRPADSDKLDRDAGLTVLELMIVLVILSLIGAVVSVQVFQQFDRAKVDVAALQLKQIQSALLLYQIDVRAVPTDELGLEALVENEGGLDGWRGPYLKNSSLLLDPWGQAISYEARDSSNYVLRSFGADKRKGGDGVNADIELASSQ